MINWYQYTIPGCYSKRSFDLQGGKKLGYITFDRFAAMSVQYIQHSLDFYLDSMVRCSIKNLDFWGGSPHYCRLHYSTTAQANRKLREIRKKIDDKGLRVVVYTPETLNYPFSYSSAEPAIKNATIKYMEAAMEDAQILGTKSVFINSGCGLRDVPREESWKRCVESVSALCETAQSMDMNLIMEQLQPYESNLLVRQEDMARMLNEVNSPALQVCVDVVAMEVMQENLNRQFELFGDKIKLIHYCDGNPSGHFILGDGNLPLEHYLEILEQHDFDGYLSLEINDSIYWTDPHDSIWRSVKYLRDDLGL
jgi:fructoselysine 3-epimerase